MHTYTNIFTNSKQMTPGSLFVCITGATVDGHDYIPEAIHNGAIEIIHSKALPSEVHTLAQQHNITLTQVLPEQIHPTLTTLLQAQYPITTTVIAITGTDGKSSTVHFCRELAGRNGIKSASIGTLGIYITDQNGTQKYSDSNLTTPDQIQSFQLLHQLSQQGVHYVFVEYSSIGIHQGRMDGITINGAVFTTFGTDHLLYHGTVAEYWRQKERLFSEIVSPDGFAIVNTPILQTHHINHRARTVIEITPPTPTLTPHGYQFIFKNHTVQTQLFAGFLAENLHTALHICSEIKIPMASLIEISATISGPTGRFETISYPNKALVIIDYAHTPEGFERLLQEVGTLRTQTNRNRIVVVFGTGGNRDESKRSIMGTIASKYSDAIIITDDNPRTEDPAKIRSQVLSGIPEQHTGTVAEIADRTQAINTALQQSDSTDIIVIAGKGHETYQIIGTEKIPYSDHQIVYTFFETH